MPRSAPLASASLIVCFTRSGPIERAITSPPCFSFKRSASSKAKLSGSFISKPMSDSLIQFPAMASGASFAGTCLMHTMMFTDFFPYLPYIGMRSFDRKAAAWRMTHALRRASLSGPAPENECGVGTAKSKGIRERIFNRRFASVIGHVIKIALGIGLLEVNGGRQCLVAQRQHANAGLQSTRAAKQVAG